MAKLSCFHKCDETRYVTTRALNAYGFPLEMVTSFKYRGEMILAADKDKPVVLKKLARARKVWSRMSRILIREGAAPWVSGLFFKAVVQAVLLFIAKT